MGHHSSPHSFRCLRLAEELQQGFGLPRIICADPEGLPFSEGQAFRAWLIDENACQPATADQYLKIILPFLTYLWFRSPSLRFTAPADQIRTQVRDYLRDKLGCGVRPHPHGNFLVTGAKSATLPSTRLYLVALRRFYECAILKGWYREANPLLWQERLLSAERPFTPRMPPESGLTVPERKRGRLPETYFCLVSGEWKPQIIEDPLLPRRVLAGFTYERDRLIVRILFESGARVSEVLGLTLGDWRACGLRTRALAMSKGSHGERVKEIWWSSETAHWLRHYVETDRQRCDPRGQRLDQLPDSAPLFVTEEGQPYAYAAFYYHWHRACVQAGLKAHPHQARHWFVTMALRYFQALPTGELRDAQRRALIAYLSWKNPETIRAYDHHLDRTAFAATHAALTQLIAGEMGAARASPAPAGSGPEPLEVPPELLKQLNQLLDDASEEPWPTP
jgi:integrase